MALCKKCGSPVNPDDQYCGACGAPLSGEGQPASAAPEPVAAPSEPAGPAAPAPEPPASQPAPAPQPQPVPAPAPASGAPATPPPAAPAPAPQSQPTAASQQSSVAPQPAPGPQPGPQPAPQPAPAPGASGGYVPPQQPPQDFSYAGAAGQPPQAQYAVAVPPQLSPLKRAWMDFKASPGKLKIILKLALFQFVPGVGGLVTSGYAYTWGKEQALGRHDPMPTKIVRPGVLDTGLYVYGVSLIVAAIIGISGGLFSTIFDALHIGAVFGILALAFTIFVAPFTQVMYMRTALAGRVRSGANLKRAWDLLTAPGKTATAFTSCWAPLAAAWALSAVIVVLFVVIVASSIVAATPVLSYSSTAQELMAVGLLFSYLPLILIFLFGIFFFTTVSTIVSARAFGFWIQDFHPEQWPEYLENAKYYADRAL